MKGILHLWAGLSSTESFPAIIMPLLPDINLQKVRKNPFTETVKGGGVDGLYSKDHKYTIPEMFSSHDIKRAQTYYMMENKLSKDHWGKWTFKVSTKYILLQE